MQLQRHEFVHVLNYHTFLFIMFEFYIFYVWVVTKVCCSLQVFHHLVVKGKFFSKTNSDANFYSLLLYCCHRDTWSTLVALLFCAVEDKYVSCKGERES